jgi:hypothetical protein
MRLEPETDQIGPDIADPLRDILQYPSFLLSAIVEFHLGSQKCRVSALGHTR